MSVLYGLLEKTPLVTVLILSLFFYVLLSLGGKQKEPKAEMKREKPVEKEYGRKSYTNINQVSVKELPPRTNVVPKEEPPLYNRPHEKKYGNADRSGLCRRTVN